MLGKWIIGIDEVGRGALAGPVTVGAFAIRKGARFKDVDLPLRDSKKLSPIQREKWFVYLKHRAKHCDDIRFVTCSVAPKIVDRLNVAEAANFAAGKAFQKVVLATRTDVKNVKVYLDGGLYLGRKKKGTSTRPFDTEVSAKTIIKGDEKYPVIGLASIVAKVTRDRKMKKLDEIHKGYAFSVHKGYGTRAHVQAIRTKGLSDVHRLTFTRKWSNL